MNAVIQPVQSEAVLGVRRFELGALWCEVRLNYAFSVNPRNYCVLASHGVPENIMQALVRRNERACFTGGGEVYNLDKGAAFRLAKSIIRERAKLFGIRAY